MKQQNEADRNVELMVISTDQEGADALEQTAKALLRVRWTKTKIQAQVGDPDSWSFAVEMVKYAIPMLTPAILLLIKQRKIKEIVVGKKVYRDITVAQYEHILEAEAKVKK